MYLSRDFQETDYSSLELIYHDAVMGQGRRGYSDEQVQVWAAFPYLYKDDFGRLVRSGYTRVMTLHHIPVAFATLNPDHYLALVYVLAEHSGRGLAGRLCDEMEQEAQRRGVGCLTTDASVLSRPLFEQKGFRLVSRQEVHRAGQTFVRFIMEKTLD
ncbi:MULTISPECIES: GNAT family N-acetyltransferase [Oceanimonas]|uniref:GNAT family N-acetyltransferase n=1 Tax=Oceanimonas doudoroffii TaxID=84158 RepID=A0A233RFZ4_9GAMM|nr:MULTISPECIES: GNAT family N-acetyltransferase [Oceanimonas]NHI01830.1 putative N-acetyltransferase YafP [Oceanimonas sp. MB9]OXY82308.1 GNAT family N-acetyltransferase [Oceanimonas doudoroffii]